MRHTVHIMLGKGVEQTVCDIKRYVIKYGDGGESHYFNALHYVEENGRALLRRAEPKEDDVSVFTAGLENLFVMELRDYYVIPSERRDVYMMDFLSSLYNSTITINDQGDSAALHICLYVPLYDGRSWQVASEMLHAADAVKQRFNIDLFMMSADMAFLFDDDAASLPERMKGYQHATAETIRQVMAAKAQCASLAHLVLMQNSNGNGLSLDLSLDSFARIAGEYAVLSVDNYNDIFNPAMRDNERPLYALGLSVLSFDRYYFVQYLLHKTYIHLLDREQVLQSAVDVNKVSQIVQATLAGNINIFTRFYAASVQPRLDKNMDHDTIISEVQPELDDAIAQLTAECQRFIDRGDLSLPEKKATLSQLLGEDDELLTGNLFMHDQLVIDDSSREPLDYFVSANNSLVALYSTMRSDDSEAEKRSKRERNDIASYGVLSDASHALVTLPSRLLDDIKQIKIRMRESTNYIRSKAKELADLDVQMQENIDSQKRLTAEGFLFEGHTFRLQKDIVEDPFDDDYKAHENTQVKVDLRHYFTPVKNQGSMGACSAFAMVGIYEYILKRDGDGESDLSEYFVYYNVRKRKGKEHEDTGSSMHDIIVTMGSEGVCTEPLCPYSDSDFFVPSDEAYADGAGRRVLKALNVKPTVDDIKSAVADGYPVAVSLRIFDSFTPRNGFVPRPTDEEVAANDYGYHAMIVCGYSDNEHIFIVRNSWGTSFGEGGYCYIPYSYFEDFLNSACIITEVSKGVFHAGGYDTKTTISFDVTNSQIKAELLRILIEEEKHRLAAADRRLQMLERDYNQLFQRLGNNSVRTTLCEGTRKRLEMEKAALLCTKQDLEKQRQEALALFDKESLRGRIRFAASVVVFVLIYAILLWAGVSADVLFFNTFSYIVYGLLGIGVLCFVIWNSMRHHKRVDLDEDYKMRTERCARDIKHRDDLLLVNKLKTHVAGMVIDSLAKLFHDLHSKNNGMRSFLGNLRTWRDEEEKSSRMSDLVHTPFLSLVSNPCLDNYFDTFKDDITKDISLCDMFKDLYVIDEQQIVLFKNHLKQMLVETLMSKLKGFSIYSSVVMENAYPYVDRRYVNLDSLLQSMDAKSTHFVPTRVTGYDEAAKNSSCKLLLLYSDDNDAATQLDDKIRQNFQIPPTFCPSPSPYKLTIVQMNCFSPQDVELLAEETGEV